jgi:hypothetical protein
VSLRSKREWSTDIGRAGTPTADWKVVGYMSLDDADATEKKLAVAHRHDRATPSAPTTPRRRGVQHDHRRTRGQRRSGVQLRELDHVLFAGVLCHRARCPHTRIHSSRRHDLWTSTTATAAPSS